MVNLDPSSGGAEHARAALLVNTASRRGAHALAVARSCLAEAGLPVVHEVVVSGGRGVDEAVDQALAHDPELLVVGGGDGTVGCAANRIAGTNVVLGVI